MYASSDCFLDIESELISLSNVNKNVCLMGDFNSRVGQLHDWFSADEFQSHLHKCDGIFNTCSETRTIIFDDFETLLHRIVRGNHANNFGYKLVDYCKNNDTYMFLVNGRVGSEKAVGGLTSKRKSTVDYVVTSADMFKFIHDFDSIDFCHLYSDVHNPISFSRPLI